MQEIFRSSRVLVEASIKDRELLVIGMSFHPRPKSGGGSMARLDKKHHFAFSYIDVLCTASFPHPRDEVQAAVTFIARYARGFRRVVTFGSSVGGFTALNFASDFGADIAIAASPQFSFDAARVPFESRWQEERKAAADSAWDNIGNGLDALREVYIFYDPASRPDTAHVEAIERHARRTIRLPIPYGGHAVSKVLNQGNAFGEIINAIVEGRVDQAAFRRSVREVRRLSNTYLMNLAASQPQCRDRLRVRLFEMAQQIKSTTGTTLALIPPLTRLGRDEEAQALMRSLVDAELGTARRIEAMKKANAKLLARVGELKRRLGDVTAEPFENEEAA